MFRDLEREQKVFTGIAAHVRFGVNLAARKQTVSADGMLVSGSYFPVLGVRPALGRLIGPDDDAAIGSSREAVLSYDYWQTAFGSDPAVINETLIVNGATLTIIGVTPREFTGTTLGVRPGVYAPTALRGELQGFKGFDDRRSYRAQPFARLAGLMAQASAAINVPYGAIINTVEAPLQKGLSDQTMERFKAKKVTLAPGARGQSSVSRDARTPITMLLAVTAFVLLIACANIANLLLARAAARSGEMAVRLSIGGSRGQLVAQLLAESAILGIVGGALGLVVARATLGLMSSLLPSQANTTFSTHIDGTAIAFTAAVTLVTTFAFGLFPALYATRPDLTSALRASTGQPSGGRSASRWRMSLATAQIALSMALLGAAGLFTKSLVNGEPRRSRREKSSTSQRSGVSPELNGYTQDQSHQFFPRLETELSQLPGVTGVTASRVPLIAGDNWGNDVGVEGFPSGPDVDNNSRYNEVGPTYFSTLGVPMLAGREFTAGRWLWMRRRSRSSTRRSRRSSSSGPIRWDDTWIRATTSSTS